MPASSSASASSPQTCRKTSGCAPSSVACPRRTGRRLRKPGAPSGELAFFRGKSNAVLRRARPGHARAVGAAVNRAVRLHAMADDPDATVLARRGERVNRALEAVEHVWLVVGHLYPERLVVLFSRHKHRVLGRLSE